MGHSDKSQYAHYLLYVRDGYILMGVDCVVNGRNPKRHTRLMAGHVLVAAQQHTASAFSSIGLLLLFFLKKIFTQNLFS